MLRTLLVTLATVLIGVPLSIGVAAAFATATGLQGQTALFAVAISSSVLWTLALFVTLWFDAGRRA